jgi:nucleoid DNA-binding protein
VPADRTLIAAIVAGGVEAVDAEDMVNRVLSAIAELLVTGKSVGIGVGRLSAPNKPVWVPGSNKRRARVQRKVALRNPAIIEKGEPYDV